MADLTIHDLDDATLEALDARARRTGRSMEEVARDLIQTAAREERLVNELERAARAVERAHASIRALDNDDARPHWRARRGEPLGAGG
jgi:plasmid stability protein